MATAVRTRTITLRAQDNCEDVHILDLPARFTGTVRECKRYARRRGYCWLRNLNYLFGGYFVHPETGNCLLPT